MDDFSLSWKRKRRVKGEGGRRKEGRKEGERKGEGRMEGRREEVERKGGRTEEWKDERHRSGREIHSIVPPAQE